MGTDVKTLQGTSRNKKFKQVKEMQQKHLNKGVLIG
jgi:hypothetical protein